MNRGGIENHEAQAELEELDRQRMRHREDLRDFHRRSWELELFISGAVLFALFHLLGRVDGLFQRIDLQVTGRMEIASFMGYYYAKLFLYALIVGFVIHLAARAFWVGLIGLDSAFPKGPDWTRLNYGPATLDAYRRIVPRPARFIVQTDAFASVIFSFTFSIAFIFLMTVLFLLVLGLGAQGLSAVSRLDWEQAFWAALGAWIVFYFGPLLVDKLIGRRLDPGRLPFRFLRRWIAIASWVMLVPLYGISTMTLFSRLSKKLMYAIFFASLFLLIGIFLVADVWVRLGLLRVDSYRHVPVDTAGNVAWTLDPTLYDAWRDDPSPRSLRPSIPSPVTRGSHLRVFVPLAPGWVASWVDRHCPELEPLREARRDPDETLAQPEIPDAQVIAARDCLLAGHGIRIDGREVTDELLFGTHPASGARGFIGYLDLRGLEPGRHELVVHRLQADDESPERRYRIPFWR